MTLLRIKKSLFTMKEKPLASVIWGCGLLSVSSPEQENAPTQLLR